MEETRVPVYLITGFLESGKTSFLSFTLQQDYFQIDGKTLLILCEEGEEEYDEEALKQCNTVVESIDSEEELTPERLAAMEILHQPERVIIEYNGMWLVSKFEEMEKPEGWGVEQHITCVDASTFQVYMANMKSLFMDMVRNADMVIFNRCQENDPLPSYRRSIKVVNQRAEIIFEDEEGELGDLFEDEMPFDIDAPVIDILPEDYGIWFEYNTEIPDGSLQFKTDFPDECSGVWIFFCPFFVEIIKILESQCLGAVMQCGAGPEIFKAASVTAVARLWWIEWISVRIR